MLRKINEGEVISTDGYRVRISHHRISYIESKGSYVVDIEHGGDPYRLNVYRNTLSVANPRDEADTSLNEGKQTEVLKRIKEALTFLSVEFEML